MEFISTEISDVILIRPDIIGDARGFFMETWHREKFAEAGINATFVQDNHSRSAAGILRGLHYQIQQPQGKLVTVVRGKVFDVAVDLRRNSASFGCWVGEELSDENQHLVWIPPGFAHGFYVIEGPADFQYKCTDYYSPNHERCIRWDDPTLAIEWPVKGNIHPALSEKDKTGDAFLSADIYEAEVLNS
jgi:dTDP-4-dehydrorhamnose 3,5-epimerase